MTALLESLTTLLEYLDLSQDFLQLPSHMHLGACNNNSPHKLEFQILHAGGWPETKVWLGVALIYYTPSRLIY